MNDAEKEINRLHNLVSDTPNGDAEKPSRITLGNTGVSAIIDAQVIRLLAPDGTELFNFPKQACGFDEQPLTFLLQIYTTGYSKGRIIGRDVMKARLRDLLGAEL